MNPEVVYTAAGAGLFVLGLLNALGRSHLVWKVLGFNLMGSGTFLLLVAGSARPADGSADPVPQAMVLTGIVVAAATTAFALGIVLRVARRTGAPYLPEDLLRPEREETEPDGPPGEESSSSGEAAAQADAERSRSTRHGSDRPGS